MLFSNASIDLLLYHKDMHNGKLIGIVAGAFAAACAILLMIRNERRKTYLTFDTLFGKARIYQVADDEGEPVRLLEVGGVVQSGTYLEERYTELVFEYLKKYDVMFDLRENIERICVLGCGGYDYPEHLIAHRDAIVDAVEIDPTITALAQRYFYLDRLVEEYETEENGRLNLICDDALAYLESTDRLYDAIVNDTFDAGEPPAHLTTPRFVQAVHNRLVVGGVYLTNVVSPLDGPEAQFLLDQIALLESVFDHVNALPCAPEELAGTEQDNVIVIAFDSP